MLVGISISVITATLADGVPPADPQGRRRPGRGPRERLSRPETTLAEIPHGPARRHSYPQPLSTTRNPQTT